MSRWLYRLHVLFTVQLYDIADLLFNPGPAFMDPHRPNARRYIQARTRWAAIQEAA